MNENPRPAGQKLTLTEQVASVSSDAAVLANQAQSLEERLFGIVPAACGTESAKRHGQGEVELAEEGLDKMRVDLQVISSILTRINARV